MARATFAENLKTWNTYCEVREWLCPITQEPLDSRAVLASDGYVYSRAAFEEWCARYPRSIVGPSGTPLVSARYTRATVLRELRDGVIRGELKSFSEWGYQFTNKDSRPCCSITREEMKQPVALFARAGQPRYDPAKPDQKGELQTYEESTLRCNEATARIESLRHTWCKYAPTEDVHGHDDDWKAGQVKLHADLAQTHVLVVDRMWLQAAGGLLPPLPTRDVPPMFHAAALAVFLENQLLDYPAGGSPSQHTNISFSKCTFKRGDPKCHTFTNCRFTDCTFNAECWCSTRFERCRFVGCTWNVYERAWHEIKPTFACEFVHPTINVIDEHVYGRDSPPDLRAIAMNLERKLRGARYTLVSRLYLTLKVLNDAGAATEEKFQLQGVSSDMSIREFEQRVAETTKIATTNFTLINPLEPTHRMTNHSKTLADYGVRSGMTLFLRKHAA